MSGIAWAVAGSVIGLVIFLVWWVKGLTNERHITEKESHLGYSNALKKNREADELLDDAAYRERLLKEDNPD